MLPRKFMDTLEQISTREECSEAIQILRRKADLLDRMTVATFQIGEGVQFTHSGFPHKGKVAQVNQKTVTVEVAPEPPFVRGGQWRVAPSLLSRTGG